MPGLDVDELEAGEKLADDRYHLIRDVLAPRAADEERGLVEADFLRRLEGEVAQVVEGLGEDRERDAEFLDRGGGGSFWAVEVS